MGRIRIEWQRFALYLVLVSLLLLAVAGTAVAAPKAKLSADAGRTIANLEEELSAYEAERSAIKRELSGRGQRFSATAAIEYIGEGTVIPVGDLWLVIDRPMGGSISGDVDGDWEFVYNGLIEHDQSGIVRGTTTFTTGEGDIISRMTAVLEPVLPIGYTIIDGQVHPVVSQKIKGIFRFLEGTDGYEGVQGAGMLKGTSYPILDPSGVHVIGFADGTVVVFDFENIPITPNPESLIKLKGRWQLP